MLNLISKEWHEQSWKLAFASVVLGGLALIGLRARIVSDESMVIFVGFLGLTLLPILMTTGLIAPERSDGSLAALLALPVRSWRVLAAKTLIGCLLCAGPLLVVAVVSAMFAGGREMSSAAMIDLFIRFILATLAMFIWIFSLTIQLSGETRVALVAVGVFIVWIFATRALAYPGVPWFALSASPLALVYRDSSSLDHLIQAINLRSESGFHHSSFQPIARTLLVQILLAALLWGAALLELRHSAGEKQ